MAHQSLRQVEKRPARYSGEMAAPDADSTTISDQKQMTGSDDLYWIYTASVSDTAATHSNLVVRYHGGGVPAIVLTPSPPKFLRFEMTAQGQQIATSWKSEHAGRFWGFKLDGLSTLHDASQWEEVQMHESQGDEGFVWRHDERLGAETLRWQGGDESGESKWKGWMVCEWKYGHPQLFWLTKGFKGILPKGAEEVVLLRKSVTRQ